MSPSRRAVLGGAAVCGLQATAALAAKPAVLTFAAIFPFSGASALLGDESFRGLALATDALNGSGGLLKRKVALIREDARDPKRATAAAKAVTAKAVAIFGTATTSAALAASAVAGLANVPYFELTAIGDPLTARGLKYLFRSCPDVDSFAECSLAALTGVVAPAMRRPAGALRLGILDVASGPSQAIAAAQAAACKKLKLDLVQTLAYPANSLNFGPLVRALRGARIDVLLHAAHPNDVVLLFRAMQQAGWRPRAVIGCGAAYGLADTRQAVGTTFDGTFAVDFPPYATDPKVARGAASLESAYRTRYGSAPRSGLSLAAYAGAGFFFAAIASAGSTDRDKIRKALLAMNVPCGAGANGWGAAFHSNGQNTRARPVALQWQKGRAVTVYPSPAALSHAAIQPAAEFHG
ncbi:MAG: ABC transporter substrate-binding protein [Acetobacteraceae bacterium]